jgi:hypothetical protein
MNIAKPFIKSMAMEVIFSYCYFTPPVLIFIDSVMQKLKVSDSSDQQPSALSYRQSPFNIKHQVAVDCPAPAGLKAPYINL